MKKTEQQIQKEVIDYLTVNGWLVWKNKNTNRGTGKYLKTYQKGVPDLTAIKWRKVVFIEIKTPIGKMSQEQEFFKEKLREHGGIYLVISDIISAKILNDNYENLQ